MSPLIGSVTWLEVVVAVCIIAILIAVFAGASKHRDFARECRERGGEWAFREQVCLRPEFVIPLGRK